MTKKTVTIIGGAGFLGKHIARRYARAGHRVRVAVRRPNEALFVRSFGNIGQVEPIQVNIRDAQSLRRAIQGSDILINTVGIAYEDRFQKFDAIHAEAPREMAKIAAQEGVSQFVHISALGADENAPSVYLTSKAKGEAGIREFFANALILRPSILFGGKDDIYNKFASMVRFFPIVPVTMGKTQFQPVFVDDVAKFVHISTENKKSGTIEIGGAQVQTMRQIFEFVNDKTCRHRWLVPLPKFVAFIMAWSFQILQIISLGLFKNHILTPDQLKSLTVENITKETALSEAGIKITAIEPVMEPYMESFRPHGEFEELKNA